MNNLEYFEIKKHIAKKITEYRKKHNYTMKDLAVIADLNVSFISDIENNKIDKPSLHTYLKLFDVLEISMPDLFAEIQNMPPFDRKT